VRWPPGHRPDGADVVHAEGKHVYPGLISADTYIGLTEIGAVRASNDHTEAGGVTQARAEAAWNPDSEIIPVTRRTASPWWSRHRAEGSSPEPGPS